MRKIKLDKDVTQDSAEELFGALDLNFFSDGWCMLHLISIVFSMQIIPLKFIRNATLCKFEMEIISFVIVLT